MLELTSFLAFKDTAEEAATFYCSIFPGARILAVTPYPDIPVAPRPGLAMVVEVEMLGQRYIFMNGGEHFKFTDAFSLAVECESQEEIDRYWAALVAGGGEHGPCGWLKDRFGLSWQIVPSVLGKLLSDPKRGRQVFQAMMPMAKLDIQKLQDAFDGK